MKKIINTPYLMLALALVGICVAFYDAYQLYNGQALWCPPPINGCNEVANSPYANIFSLPVGITASSTTCICSAWRRCSRSIRSHADCALRRLPTPPWARASRSISCTCRSPSSTHSAFTVSSLRLRPFFCSSRHSPILERRARRQGDRIAMLFAAVLWSLMARSCRTEMSALQSLSGINRT